MNCHNCGGRTNMYLCPSCVKRVRGWLRGSPELGGITELMTQLRIVSTRQHRYTDPYHDGPKPKRTVTPLPHHVRSADVADKLARALVDTACRVATVQGTVPVLSGVSRLHMPPHPRDEHHPTPEVTVAIPYNDPGPAAVSASHWLLSNLNGLARCEWAGECFRALERAIEEAEVVCVPEPPRWFAGQCGCGTGLYADVDDHGHPLARNITCSECGVTHQVEDLHKRMLDAAQDKTVTSTTALTWARVFLSAQVPKGTWDAWVGRGRIVPHGGDTYGRPVYRFGDVCALTVQWLAARQRRRTGSV